MRACARACVCACVYGGYCGHATECKIRGIKEVMKCKFFSKDFGMI